jgi:hypothetical protein
MFFEQFVIAGPLVRLHIKRIVNGIASLPWTVRIELSAGSGVDAHSFYRAVDNPFIRQAYQQRTKRKKPKVRGGNNSRFWSRNPFEP